MNCKLIEVVNIVIDEKQYGEIKRTEYDNRWHSCIRSVSDGGDGILIQGFGDTPTAALYDSFVHTRKEFERGLIELEKTRKLFFGDFAQA